MGNETITSSGTTSTYSLTAPLSNGTNIEFLNNGGTAAGVLLLSANTALDAFNVVTATVNGSLYASANIGGSVYNFQPGSYGVAGDQITISHIASLFSTLDVAGTAAADNADFASKATDGAGIEQFFIAPDGTMEYLPQNAFTFNVNEIHVIDEIAQSLFGTNAAAAGATLDLTFVDQLNPNSNSKFADAVFTTNNATVNPCFAAGTRILSVRGEIAVEALAVGDFLITHSGEERAVVWIGRREVEISGQANPEGLWPVVIEAEALADGVPRRRLLVSPDHALLLHGVLVPAKALVNWSSIRQDRGVARMVYYHVELARHDVLFAEGAPAESFLDTGHRAVFDNAPGADLPDMAAMQALREAKSYAPLCLGGVKLVAIRQAIAARQPGVRLAGE